MIRKIVCLVFAMTMLGAVAVQAEDVPFGKEVGQKLKPFELKDTEGKVVTLNSLGGKNTVIIFMQSSCTQCRDEIKAVNEMYDKIKGKVNVVAVGVDLEPERLTQYKTAYKVPYPILLDPGFTVATSVGVRVTPATVVVDKDGKIAQKILGGIGQGEVEELFAKL